MATADVVVVELQAKVDKYNASITQAATNFKTKMGEVQTAANNAGTAIAAPLNRVTKDAPKAASAIKSVGGEVGHLGAQFNDIAVQLAGGQSPFLIALQQGSQINQALGQAGTGGVLKALGGAFAGLVNPVSLATIATITLIGYAVQYFASVTEGGQKSEKTLKEEAALIQAVADKWGVALPALKAYADAQEDLADKNKKVAATQAAIDGVFKKLNEDVPGLDGDVADLVEKLQTIGADPGSINRLISTFNVLKNGIYDETATAQEARDVQDALATLFIQTSIPAAQNLANVFRDSVAPALAGASEAAKALKKDLENLPVFDPRDPRFNGLTGPDGNVIPLPNSAPSPSLLGVDDVLGGSGHRTTSEFLKSRAVSQKIAERVDLLDKDFADRLAQLLLLFPNIKIASAFRTFDEQKAIRASGVRPAAKEGHSLHEKGLAADLSPGGKISLPEFYAAAKELGIVFPVKGDPFHAQPAGAQSLRSADSGGVSEGDKRAASINRVVQALNAEAQAQQLQVDSAGKSNYEREKEAAILQAVNQLKAQGITLSDTEYQQIVAAADGRAKATAALKDQKDATEALAQKQKELNDFGRDVLGGIIDDLRAGKSAGDIFADVLDKLANKLEQLALDALFPTDGTAGAGGGGIFGGLLGLLGSFFKAQGGPVKRGQPYVVGDRNGLQNAEVFVPDQNGMIVPNIKMPSRSGGSPSSGGGGYLDVRTVSEVVNGNLVGTMTTIAGIVNGQSVRQVNRAIPGRISNAQLRGV